MIGYTPAEQERRTKAGLPPATGKDDPPAQPGPQPEAVPA